MKPLVRSIVILAILGAVGAASAGPIVAYWRQRNQPKWKFASVSKGDIVAAVNSTGTVKPVLSVSIGSFVSGPIKNIYVDFNDEVTKGQILAEVDDRLLKADVARERATLATRQADILRVKADLQQAINNEQRALALRKENQKYLSDQQMDQYKFNKIALEAQLEVAKAAVDQAKASLGNAETNLEYTRIQSPVNGIVLDRKMDQGQTLAAAFQVPEIFIVAPDIRKKIHIFASVDEADIGLIQRAKADGRLVRFMVDAYPEDLFEGQIEQIRVSSTTTQNVVTYPVVVSAVNPDLKLLPGMTATISFETDRRSKVVRIPNSALRFYPDIKQVREQDRKILEGSDDKDSQQEQEDTAGTLTADERVEARRKRNRRHVWVADGKNQLKAIAVTTGLSDNKFTEMLEGGLKVGDRLVMGIEPKIKGY